VSPEQGQCPKWLAGCCANTGKHGANVGARAWRLGCLILATGCGLCPAPAVTAGGSAWMAGAPAVAACSRLRR
jgi:hypothetical protein